MRSRFRRTASRFGSRSSTGSSRLLRRRWSMPAARSWESPWCRARRSSSYRPRTARSCISSRTGNRILTQPVGDGDIVVVGSGDNHVYAAAWQVGEIVWEHEETDDIIALVKSEESVVLATRDGAVTAPRVGRWKCELEARDPARFGQEAGPVSVIRASTSRRAAAASRFSTPPAAARRASSCRILGSKSRAFACRRICVCSSRIAESSAR